MILDLFFDRIVILTLKGNEERVNRAKKELLDKELSANPIVFNGVRGSLVGPPKWWFSGGGAWGCMQSHLRIVQDALMDGVQNLLIIEDDAIWQNDSNRLVFDFLSQLPDDWGQIYFGGQHRHAHTSFQRFDGKPAIIRPKSVHRTHAFGLKHSTMAKFCQHIMDAESYIKVKKDHNRGMHIDHQLEIAHAARDWNVYAPSFWLCGQGENRSDINNNHQPERWWHPRENGCAESIPVVVCSKKPSADIFKRLHFGRHISEENAMIDEGVMVCEPDDLISIIKMVAREAYAHQMLPAVYNWPHKTEVIKNQWPGGIILAEELTIEELARLCDYPGSKIIKHSWINP